MIEDGFPTVAPSLGILTYSRAIRKVPVYPSIWIFRDIENSHKNSIPLQNYSSVRLVLNCGLSLWQNALFCESVMVTSASSSTFLNDLKWNLPIDETVKKCNRWFFTLRNLYHASCPPFLTHKFYILFIRSLLLYCRLPSFCNLAEYLFRKLLL